MKTKNIEMDSILWLSYYIKNMHLYNESLNNIYKFLKDFNELEEGLSNLFDKYCLYIKISRNNFIRNLMKIYKSIEKNMCNVDILQPDEVLKRFNSIVMRPEKMNFEKIAFPLFLFIQKLYYQLLRDGVQKVFFLAREGQFMKKMFDTFQSKSIGPKIKTEYLYVSRASTFIGTLDSLDDEDFHALLIQYPNMSLKNFCKNLGFTSEEISQVADDMNMNFDLKIDNIVNSNQLKRLIKNKMFSKLYENKRVQAKKTFIQYLSQFGDDYKDKLYIVDVGWKGTIQNNIQSILPDTTVIGYYLGIVHYDEIENYDRKNAVLFENSLLKRTSNCYLYNSNRSIFEMLLAADHGSTSYYKANSKGVVEPVLKEEEKEYELFTNKIQPIQENILEVFEKLLNILNQPCNQSYVEKIINNKFFDLMFKPSRSEIEEYQTFYHFENFGVLNYSYFNTQKKVNLARKMYRYMNFASFIRNDDTWQYLKLYNNKMSLGIKVLYSYKKYKFKKMDVI